MTNTTTDGDRQLIFGDPDEWKHFESRHQLFFERYSHLREALHTAFLRTGETAEPIDRFVFFYGRLCCEDFFEVLLCCGNGRGAAALKLLRTLYERAVTLRYLHEHPDELTAFWDFNHVQEYKLFVAIEESFGRGAVSEKTASDLKDRYDAVKDTFKVPVCKKCDTYRVNHTWNRLNFVAMAQQTGSLGELTVPAYYIPMKHAHATAGSMYSRLEQTPEGVTFDASAQRGLADRAFIAAHNIILQVIGVQGDQFSIPGLSEKIGICIQDFQDIHRRQESVA
jgi:hypothetical protein